MTVHSAQPGRPSIRPTKLRGVMGLRGAGVLAVMLYHCWLYSAPDHVRLTYGGWEELIAGLRSGRVMFFALSGFLLYRSYTFAFAEGRRPQPLWNYLSGRVLRVLPGYWFAFILVALVFGIARTNIVTLSLGNLSDRPWTVLANLLVVQNYFPGTVLTGIGPTWSLGVEIAFYALLPIVGGIAFRMTQRGVPHTDAAFLGAGFFVVLGFATKFALAAAAATGLVAKSTWTDAPYTLIMLSMPFNADLFGCGMVVAALEASIASESDAGRWMRRFAVLALVSALVMGLGFALRLPIAGIVGEVVAAVGAGLGIYYLTVRTRESRLLHGIRRVLDTRFLGAVGFVSFGVFLWNEPTILWLRENGYTFPGWGGLVANYLIMMATTLAFAKVTSLLVEQPALRIKRGIQGRLRPSDAATAGEIRKAASA